MAISKINTRALANDSVTTDKVADNAITTDMVASGEIGVTDLADGSITNAKISSTAAIAPSKIDMASVAALTMSGGLTIATGEAGLIATGTSDAADNKRITLAGGGSASWDRGSYLRVAGNESSTGGDLDLIAGNVSGADINMYTGGDISATLTNAGNLLVGANAVGMGTSSSVTGAAIRGSIGYFEIARDGSNPVRLNRQSSEGSIIDFAKDGATVGSIGTHSSDRFYLAGASYGIAFDTSDVSMLPTTNTGGGTNGVINLGKSDARWKDLHLSGTASVGGNIDLPTVNTYITGQGHNVLQVDATRTYYYGGSNGAQFRTSNNASELLNILDGGEVEIPNSGQFKAASSNATKYVRMYAGGGTGKWDIYGNGANLRITDNQSAGVLAVDTGATFGSNVGIGTSSPTTNYGTNLNVHSSATNGAALHLTDGTTGNSNSDGFHLITTGGLAYVWNREATDMVFATSNLERMRISSDGKIGIGQVPATDWSASYDALQVGAQGVMFAHTSGGGDASTWITNNAYVSTGGWKALSTNEASHYQQKNGEHYWSNAPSVSAGAGLGFTNRMKLDASGNLLVGKIAVDGTTTGHVLRGSDSAIFTRNTTNSASESVQVGRGNSNGRIVRYNKNGVAIGYIGVESDDLSIHGAASGHKGLRFGNGAIVPINNVGGQDNGLTNLGGNTSQFNNIYSGSANVGGINYDAYNATNSSASGLNVVAYYSFDNNSVNSIGSDFNNRFTMLYVSTNKGTSAIPMYGNGGAGVAWQVKIFDLDSLVFRNNQVDWVQGGSSGNTFRLISSAGGGAGSIQRTGGSLAYQVWISRISGGSA